MPNLNHAPPRRSDWALNRYDNFVAGCQSRHEAAKADWLAIHEEAGLTTRERFTRAIRSILNRGK